MTDNILFVKETGADIVNVLEDFDAVFKTALCTVRKVNLRNIARDYHFELNPSRVRNIFICSLVVF